MATFTIVLVVIILIYGIFRGIIIARAQAHKENGGME